jgi:large subunit ribosomal protein L18
MSSRKKRKQRIRKSISGTADVPRVTVFRSNRKFYAQAIDDISAETLTAIDSKENPKVEDIEKLGESFGKKLKKNKIEKAIFDRNGYKYHGKVKSFAEGIRSAGIKL